MVLVSSSYENLTPYTALVVPYNGKHNNNNNNNNNINKNNNIKSNSSPPIHHTITLLTIIIITTTLVTTVPVPIYSSMTWTTSLPKTTTAKFTYKKTAQFCGDFRFGLDCSEGIYINNNINNIDINNKGNIDITGNSCGYDSINYHIETKVIQSNSGDWVISCKCNNTIMAGMCHEPCDKKWCNNRMRINNNITNNINNNTPIIDPITHICSCGKCIDGFFGDKCQYNNKECTVGGYCLGRAKRAIFSESLQICTCICNDGIYGNQCQYDMYAVCNRRTRRELPPSLLLLLSSSSSELLLSPSQLLLVPGIDIPTCNCRAPYYGRHCEYKCTESAVCRESTTIWDINNNINYNNNIKYIPNCTAVHVYEANGAPSCRRQYNGKIIGDEFDEVRIKCTGGNASYCNNHGTGTYNNDKCSCICNIGYSGERCDILCNSEYCNKKGISYKTNNMSKCNCNEGYSGYRCEVKTQCTSDVFCGGFNNNNSKLAAVVDLGHDIKSPFNDCNTCHCTNGMSGNRPLSDMISNISACTRNCTDEDFCGGDATLRSVRYGLYGCACELEWPIRDLDNYYMDMFPKSLYLTNGCMVVCGGRGSSNIQSINNKCDCGTCKPGYHGKWCRESCQEMFNGRCKDMMSYNSNNSNKCQCKECFEPFYGDECKESCLGTLPSCTGEYESPVYSTPEGKCVCDCKQGRYGPNCSQILYIQNINYIKPDGNASQESQEIEINNNDENRIGLHVIIISVSVGGGALVIILLSLVIYLLYCRKKNNKKRSGVQGPANGEPLLDICELQAINDVPGDPIHKEETENKITNDECNEGEYIIEEEEGNYEYDYNNNNNNEEYNDSEQSNTLEYNYSYNIDDVNADAEEKGNAEDNGYFVYDGPDPLEGPFYSTDEEDDNYKSLSL